MNLLRPAARWVLAVFFVVAGANHFISPAIYLGMVPAWLPWPAAMNAISGAAQVKIDWKTSTPAKPKFIGRRVQRRVVGVLAAAQVLGGIGLLLLRTRRIAGWGLIALLIAVFPANVHVALQGHMPGTTLSPLVLWWRLPFQAVFLGAVWWVALSRR